MCAYACSKYTCIKYVYPWQCVYPYMHVHACAHDLQKEDVRDFTQTHTYLHITMYLYEQIYINIRSNTYDAQICIWHTHDHNYPDIRHIALHAHMRNIPLTYTWIHAHTYISLQAHICEFASMHTCLHMHMHINGRTHIHDLTHVMGLG
jgi:hypothetical protein